MNDFTDISNSPFLMITFWKWDVTVPNMDQNEKSRFDSGHRKKYNKSITTRIGDFHRRIARGDNMSVYLNLIATIAAAIAALASVYIATKAFSHTQALNQPILSLVKTDITMELEWSFLDIKFIFENVGNQSLKILKFDLGLYDGRTQNFDSMNIPPLVNTLPPKQTFIHRIQFKIDQDRSRRLKKFMEINFPKGKVSDQHPKAKEFRELYGQSIFIFNMEYQGITKEKQAIIQFKHYIAFEGMRTYNLSQRNYDEIKSNLPKDFS